MFPNAYSASFFYNKTLLYPIADANYPGLPQPQAGITTLVVCKTADTQLPETENSFLASILKAVGLPGNRVQVMPFVLQNAKLPIATLLRNFGVKKIITFGFQPDELMVNITPQLYLPFELSQTQILLADALNSIEKDKSKKQLLWQQLKQMFGI
ncbi:hypothetical protein C7N43_22365 [Sphingobacteriales bacterium UPWRP_1]|nr:hypothetical protein B6N25_07580 [Sphingobacteriales bacterium TSM_CSS]PSJ74762.1 hypothetical protein C7N43_22365 [Sphingobacteriales bacterium UPWRP_1]